MQTKCIVKSVKEVDELAKIFAKKLKGGEVVLLYGNLGSGKTTFAKLVFKHLRYKGIVTSPSYTIMQQYKTKEFNIFHFDLFRLNNIEEAVNLEIEKYLFERNASDIVFIEWPEKIQPLLKGKFEFIEIDSLDEDSRIFKFETKTI